MLKILAHAAPFVTLTAIAVLAFAGSFSSPSPIAIIPYLVALSVVIWARSSFPRGTFRGGAKPAGTGLIRRGPYRLIRHPMYAAALLLVWTASGVQFTWWSLAVGLAVTTAVAGRIVWEERLLREAFSDFPEYAKSTRAVIPYLL